METGRRSEIEAAASALFREHGYAGTSVRDIARAIDLQGASLYAHVASKEDVLWSIVDGMGGRFEDAVAAAVLGSAGQPDPAETLRAMVRAHVLVVLDDVGRASVFVHEWRALTPERRDDVARRRDAYEDRFRTVIERGLEVGRFGSVDPVVAAAFILTALNGLVTWYRADGRLDRDAIADAYSDLALRTVAASVGGD